MLFVHEGCSGNLKEVACHQTSGKFPIDSQVAMDTSSVMFEVQDVLTRNVKEVACHKTSAMLPLGDK